MIFCKTCKLQNKKTISLFSRWCKPCRENLQAIIDIRRKLAKLGEKK